MSCHTSIHAQKKGEHSQTYEQLWQMVDQYAEKEDRPQTALTYLSKIQKRALSEKAYGHLLKAELDDANLRVLLSRDSLPPCIDRLEARLQATEDAALQAVYHTVLSKIYKSNRESDDSYSMLSQKHHQQALANRDVLAATKSEPYKPFVVEHADSRIFGHDLLSLIGIELGEWQWLSEYYTKAGNRQAACITAWKAVHWSTVPFAQRIENCDSLLALYGDLDEAALVAEERYDLMEYNTTNAEQAAWLMKHKDRWKPKFCAGLKNSWEYLIQPEFYISTPQPVTEPGKPIVFNLSKLCNVSSVTLRIYRTTLNGDTNLNPSSENDYKKMSSGLTELKDRRHEFAFASHEPYDVFTDSATISGLPAGVYMVECSSTPVTKTVRFLLFVSDVRVLTEHEPGNITRFIVVSATTGHPIGKASLRLSTGYWSNKKSKTLTCDDNGELLHNDAHHYEAFAYTDADSYCPPSSQYGQYSYYSHEYGRQQTQLFTDRSIYRPGQKVYVTAITWKEVSPTENKAVEGNLTNFELYDANHREIASQIVETDAYGHCSATFTLPKNLLNGHFSIRTEDGITYFRVEDYKRPSFQVEFNDYKETYKAGDTIRVSAKATTYAGVPVQGGKVRYTVRRQVAFWWMSFSRYWQTGSIGRGTDSSILMEDEGTTADDGTFEIRMPLTLPPDSEGSAMFYSFVAEATVTDQAGESHTAQTALPLGTRETTLTCNIDDKIRADKRPTVTFSRMNAAGKEISGTVRYRIDDGRWNECAANAEQDIIGKSLKPGKHRLEAVCGNDTVSRGFTVFSLDDKRPADGSDDWFYVSDTAFPNDGTPVTLQVGSSAKNVYVVYGIFAGDSLIERGAKTLNNELINLKLKYKEEYGNGLLLTFAWVKDGKCYRHQQSIGRPLPDRRLQLQWQTFRDRLLPGQQEEWRLTVSNPDGTPADASLLAVLYDKSLDQLMPLQWSLTPSLHISLPSTNWLWQTWYKKGDGGIKDIDELPEIDYDFSKFYDYLYNIRQDRLLVLGAAPMVSARNGALMMRKSAMATQSAVVYESADEVTAVDAAGMDVAEQEADNGGNPSGEQVQMRENLQETAFCYPSLRTDSAGSVTLSFTLPESLTTWHMMGIANTAGMLYGSISGDAVAQKDVMIQPQMPRFVRKGDNAQLSARIFNTADHDVSGTALLQIESPETGNLVISQEIEFAVATGKTTTVSFLLPTDLFEESLLVCKVSAVGDGFSDGEQHYLPVLPNKEMVTRTMPVTQHSPGTYGVDLDKLFPTGSTDRRLTVEYTNKPQWLMVQALSLLGSPSASSAIELASAYYANSLAEALLNACPRAKHLFEQWKEESGSEQTLQSQLSKNTELKELLLEETPWVWAANSETSQRQQLAEFFDTNAMRYCQQEIVGKVRKLQLSDGSFTWYPGMPGSTMVTVTVAEMLARLKSMDITPYDLNSAYQKAIRYLGKEMVTLVDEMKKLEKKGHKPTFPSITALRWLYICAISDQLSAKTKLPANVVKANEYLIALLKKDMKRQSIYEKALTAVILHKHQEQKLAASYARSLKEYTVFTEEMGRYYDTRRAGYSWFDYKIPTEVAAIEALSLITPEDTLTVDEMRRWLLQEKRTQLWGTTINSTNAIYAFLNGRTKEELIAQQPSSNTQIAIDGTDIALPKSTAGIGYVKTAISNPQGHALTFSKSTSGTSWGAVYAQFMQPTADVEASGSGMSVKREIIAINGHRLEGDSHNAALHVGDRLTIRITIECERDMDFVQVIDRRAACMEPVTQLSGYHNGAYVTPKDYATNYYYYGLAKGRYTIVTDYFVDREGSYLTGTCSVQCAYAPEFKATAQALSIKVDSNN